MCDNDAFVNESDRGERILKKSRKNRIDQNEIYLAVSKITVQQFTVCTPRSWSVGHGPFCLQRIEVLPRKARQWLESTSIPRSSRYPRRRMPLN